MAAGKGLPGDVWKIWGGFSTHYKNGCGVLQKNINMNVRIVVFRLKNIELCVIL